MVLASDEPTTRNHLAFARGLESILRALVLTLFFLGGMYSTVRRYKVVLLAASAADKAVIL